MRKKNWYQNLGGKLPALCMASIMGIMTFTGCSADNTSGDTTDTAEAVNVTQTAADPQISVNTEQNIEEAKEPKYIFLFIGDGMGFPQAAAYGIYTGTTVHNFTGTLDDPTIDNLPQAQNASFMNFPTVGAVTTYDASKFVTDSASAATAIASGVKTLDGSIGVDPNGESVPTIAEMLKEQKGYKIGVITTVSLNHATPAGFYAHVKSRSDLLTIGEHLAASDFDFFGGGGINVDEEEDRDVIMAKIEDSGYNIVNTKEDILNLTADSGKTVAINEVLSTDSDINYSVDQTSEDLKLSDYVRKGIEVLDNDTGFFMMVEGGKIDWSAHTNDAYTTINEVQELDSAVDEAVKFYAEHPEETLILVTGDHETGGMALGNNTTFYDTYYAAMDKQQMSFKSFNTEYLEKYRENQTPFEDAMKDVKEQFGLMMPDDPDAEQDDTLLMTNDDVESLRKAYEVSMIPYDDRELTKEYENKYSQYDYEPFQLMITRTVNSKVGIGWATTAHSGLPVAIYAMGAGMETFAGFIDNTDICNNLKILTNIE